VYVKVKLPCNRPWSPIGFRDVEVPPKFVRTFQPHSVCVCVCVCIVTCPGLRDEQ
jgi:hypothetical protein